MTDQNQPQNFNNKMTGNLTNNSKNTTGLTGTTGAFNKPNETVIRKDIVVEQTSNVAN